VDTFLTGKEKQHPSQVIDLTDDHEYDASVEQPNYLSVLSAKRLEQVRPW
jgi:hypothetical protein